MTVVIYKIIYEVSVTANVYSVAISFSKDFCKKILKALTSLYD